jgi:putative DNA methylase
MTVPRLIEAALPIREISAESGRDKSLRHGHISTLTLWFARIPLAASRAVVFASLVPDPDHPECATEFRAAVEQHLKTHVPDALKSYRRGRITNMDSDPYLPYEGMEDTLRNRLLMFVGKWSREWWDFEHGKSKTKPKPEFMLDDRSMAKWENCDPQNEQGRKVLWVARELIRAANSEPTTMIDPFAGGGAMPLEAARLGCKSFANDYNPVAYFTLRATCEYPQKYGKPGSRTVAGHLTSLEVPNVLSHDVQCWAEEVLRRAKKKIGRLFPVGSDKRTVVGYLWARTVPCSNTTCKAEIPLLNTLSVCSKPNKNIALTMQVEGKKVSFGLAREVDIERIDGTMLKRGNTLCPVCRQTTSVKNIRQAGIDGKLGERLLAVITETNTSAGKDYRLPEASDEAAFEEAQRLAAKISVPNEPILPEITVGADDDDRVANSTGIRVHLYGMKTWGSLFNPRQLLVMQTLIDCLHEVLIELDNHIRDLDYRNALALYLNLWINRTAQRGARVAIWNNQGENVEHPFSLAKISMTWDYAEINPFSNSTGSAAGGLDWIMRVIEHESPPKGLKVQPAQVFLGDAAKLPVNDSTMSVVVTDPPYFDEISYADISDYFYIWLKRGIADRFPDVFTSPLTPKTEEATALLHRHDGNTERAERHFTSKLAAAFAESRRVLKPGGVVTVMFAHQSTEAWTSLVHSLFEAGLNITATYPIQTVRANRPRELNSSALASSITVVCRPRVAVESGLFKEVKNEIEEVVRESVRRFWAYGFRGADLIVACYGPAVGVFGQYKHVEKQGEPVRVPQLLQLVREAALRAIAGEFSGDSLSRLYFVWANLYGVSEQKFDDMRLVVQVGGDAEEAIDVARGRGLFVVTGPTCRLAVLRDRADRAHLGDDAIDPLIDQLHRALLFWQAQDRSGLVQYLHGHDLGDHAGFWRLAQALFEVLPRDSEDWKLVSALLGERNTLQMEIKRRDAASTGQNADLFSESSE